MNVDGFELGFVRVNGFRIFYRSRGEPKKGTVLALHEGPGGSSVVLLPFADLAQFGYRVVLFDHAGGSRSQRPRARAYYTMERRATEVDGVRRALGLGRVHLIGHSFGGPTALGVALRFPKTLRSLTVVSGVTDVHEFREDTWRPLRSAPRAIRETIERYEGRGDSTSPRYREARKKYDKLRFRTSEGKRIGFEGSTVDPWEVVEYMAHYNRRVDRMFVGAAADQLTAPVGGSLGRWILSPRLKEIRTPTLVAVGRHDSVDIRFSRRMHRSIHGSELIVFERSGHGAFSEERDLFMETQRQFLDKHQLWLRLGSDRRSDSSHVGATTLAPRSSRSSRELPCLYPSSSIYRVPVIRSYRGRRSGHQ